MALPVGILIPFFLFPLETNDASNFFSQLPLLTPVSKVPLFLQLTPQYNAGSLSYPPRPQQAAEPPYNGTDRT